MRRGRFIFWYYFLLLAVLFAIVSLTDFSDTPSGARWLLVVFLAILIANPFLILWYRERGRVRGELVSAAANSSNTEALKIANQKLEIQTRELQSKEVALNLAYGRLKELEQAKSEFVSVTTHQLRTPLAAIKWTFHMLLTGSLGEITADQKTFLERGFQSTERVIGIVNDLLNLDYIAVEQWTYKFIPTNLKELVDSVIFELEKQARDKGVTMTFELPPSLPLIPVDPIRMSMVIENLLENAIKYTTAGGQVSVRIDDARLNSSPASVEIVVRDTGIGIPAAEQPKIFQRFYRSSNALRASPDGSGLGLFIAQDIINHHRGQIWFESVEGQGTTFHVAIPMVQNQV